MGDCLDGKGRSRQTHLQLCTARCSLQPRWGVEAPPQHKSPVPRAGPYALPVLCCCCRFAAALKAVDKLIAPSDEVAGPSAAEALVLKQSLLKKLGWSHWCEYERGWARVKFPQKLPPL